MPHEITTGKLPVSRNGILVVDGYGVRVTVDRGHLVVHDGIGRARREARLARATCPVRRLVILGHTGFVTLDAIRWLTDVGVGFVHLDPDGRVLVASGSLGLDDPRLRRAQALSWGTEVGMTAAIDVLDAKLRGQATVVSRLSGGDTAAAIIESCRPLLRLATTPVELMVPEAAAASAYWAAWAPLELRWATKDGLRVPEHWRTFGGRASPLTGNPRTAGNPANAVLNYLYGLLESEARFACLAIGLDPGLGVLHSDLRARDSLALDVMEAVRPDVDEFVLKLVRERTFRAGDFRQDRRGAVKVLAPLTHELAETMPIWRARLAPVVERVALMIASGPDSRVTRRPTLLTDTNRSRGRDDRRVGRRGAPSSRVRIAATCRACGGAVPARGREYCDSCLPARLQDQRATVMEAASAALIRARAEGSDRSHGGSSATSRGAKVAEARRLATEWGRYNGSAPHDERFRKDVLPLIQGFPARRLAELTGLSRPYCSAIIRGERVPHPRWWARIAELASPVSDDRGPYDLRP